MIQKISLSNFKSIAIKDATFSNINLLTGINGKGKSSLLQVLLLLSQTWRMGKYTHFSPKGEFVDLGSFDDVHNRYSEDNRIEISLTINDEQFVISYEKNGLFGELCGLQYNGVDVFGDLEIMSVGDDMSHSISSSHASSASISDYPSLMALKNMHYIAANRRIPEGQYKYLTSQPATYIFPDGFNISEFIWKLSKDDLEQLKSYMVDIFGSASLSITQEGEYYILRLDSLTNSPFLYEPKNVGYGYGYVLSLLTTLLLAKSNDTVIVENPEAHLHPSAQSKIMQVIAKVAVEKNIQFFIETHSDHIVNALQVLIRKKEFVTKKNVSVLFFGDEIENLQLTDTGHILSPPKMFCDQYYHDLNALFL